MFPKHIKELLQSNTKENGFMNMEEFVSTISTILLADPSVDFVGALHTFKNSIYK